MAEEFTAKLFPPLSFLPPKGWRGRKRKVTALGARDAQSPTTAPEVKQQPGNKTIKTAEGRAGGIPRPTLPPFPHPTPVPLLSPALSGPSKSHPGYRTVTQGTILKVSIVSL